jgi:hypothetical protein
MPTAAPRDDARFAPPTDPARFLQQNLNVTFLLWSSNIMTLPVVRTFRSIGETIAAVVLLPATLPTALHTGPGRRFVTSQITMVLADTNLECRSSDFDYDLTLGSGLALLAPGSARRRRCRIRRSFTLATDSRRLRRRARGEARLGGRSRFYFSLGPAF